MTTPYRRGHRRGRSVVCSLHVHLVFISKYKRGVLSEPAHRLLRDSFEQVCDDFGAGLLESDGEDDHVHLRVAYPATIQLSRLVNSLKGRVVWHSEEGERPRGHAKALGRPSVEPVLLRGLLWRSAT
jgi:REP element-mobilizing transposase RayT